jgi:transcriptional regulator with XRE-family HTH domain
MTPEQREEARELAEDLRAHIGYHVRRLRLERGWTQGELGERAGMHPTQVSQLEAGGDCKVSTVARLAVALGVRIAELTLPPKQYAALTEFD